MFGDTEEIVAEKVKLARECEINVVLCVGETKEQHDKEQTVEVVYKQLDVLKDHVIDWNK